MKVGYVIILFHASSVYKTDNDISAESRFLQRRERIERRGEREKQGREIEVA